MLKHATNQQQRENEQNKKWKPKKYRGYRQIDTNWVIILGIILTSVIVLVGFRGAKMEFTTHTQQSAT